jgi:hypothetical protein
VTYLVSSGYMWEQKEPFQNWTPALLTYLGRLRENEAGCGARVMNTALCGCSERCSLTYEEQQEVEEYGNL